MKEVVISIKEEDADDEALLRSLIRPEEDRLRLHPELPWRGGYRWFRSANVIPMERYRERLQHALKAKHRSH